MTRTQTRTRFAYSAVITGDEARVVERYLYTHSELLWSAKGPSGRTYGIVRTTAEVTAADGNGSHAYDVAGATVRTLAEHQCQRLQSGLHFAIVGGERLGDAIHVIAQQIGQQDLGHLNHDHKFTELCREHQLPTTPKL